MGASYRDLRLPKYNTADAPSKRLARLQHQWDRKLRESGFQDIEHRNPNGTLSHHIKDNSLDRIASHKEDQAEYYRRAGQWTYHRPAPWPNAARAAVLAEIDRQEGYRHHYAGMAEAYHGSAQHEAVTGLRAALYACERACRKEATRLARKIAHLRNQADTLAGLESAEQQVWRLHAEGLTDVAIRKETGRSLDFIAKVLHEERTRLTVWYSTNTADCENHVLYRGGRTPVRDSGYDRKDDE